MDTVQLSAEQYTQLYHEAKEQEELQTKNIIDEIL